MLLLPLLVACPAPQSPRHLVLESCFPELVGPSWGVIEPGHQLTRFQLHAHFLCIDGGVVQPESVAVTGVTDTGVNVVERVEVQLPGPTAEMNAPTSIDLEVDVPINAKVVTFEFRVEPTIGVHRQILPVAPVVELPFAHRLAARCDMALPWEGEGTICLSAESVSVRAPARVRFLSQRATAVAVTPAGLWAVADNVEFLPVNGGPESLWFQSLATPKAIASVGDRVFVSSDLGVAELSPGSTAPIAALPAGARFTPTAMRVEGTELVLATQERIDRVPVSTFSTDVPKLPVALNPAVLNLNSTAGLWRISGQRVELTTASGVLSLEFVRPLISDVMSTRRRPALTDETPLVYLGQSLDGRGVWFHVVEDLDAGTVEPRYLAAPPGYQLTRATSDTIFASSPDGVAWTPRQ